MIGTKVVTHTKLPPGNLYGYGIVVSFRSLWGAARDTVLHRRFAAFPHAVRAQEPHSRGQGGATHRCDWDQRYKLHESVARCVSLRNSKRESCHGAPTSSSPGKLVARVSDYIMDTPHATDAPMFQRSFSAFASPNVRARS